MSFTEVNVFGVYVAPIFLLAVATWVVALGSRWTPARYGLLHHVWHPALFVFAVYVVVLSSMVLVTPR